MNPERFQLHFGAIRLGEVAQTDADFPNVWGVFEPDPALTPAGPPEVARLAEFVALVRESIRRHDADLASDSPSDADAIDERLANEFGDVCESSDWRLVAAAGESRPILCPIFRHDGEIVWRW